MDRTMNKRPRLTRSQAKKDTFTMFASSIVPVLLQNEWIGIHEVAALDQTCRAGKVAEDTWTVLAHQLWPTVEKLVGDGEGSVSSTYRGLFGKEFPRVWLTMEVEQICALSEWSKLRHLDVYGIMECGCCGCSECGGVPIDTDFRYERVEQLCGNEAWSVPRLEIMIKRNFFCQTCYELLLELEAFKEEEYKQVPPTKIFDVIMEHLWTAQGHLLKIGGLNETLPYSIYANDRYLWSLQRKLSGREDWMRLEAFEGKELALDDLLVVIAFGLIHSNCTKIQNA